MRVLLVEDDREASGYLARALEDCGHAVAVAETGEQGLEQAQDNTYDVLIVDRMLPGIDGLALIRNLRERSVAAPALILSALGAVDDRVTGLKAGGDDYLTKPYHFEELLARIDALARRGRDATPESRLKVAGVEIDLYKRSATRDGRRLNLTTREFSILEFLMRHAGQVVTRKMLLEGVWNYHFDPQTNVIDVHISRLRQAVDIDGAPTLIRTVRGAGYVFGP
jgi:two-component system OmpR family response regulator